MKKFFKKILKNKNPILFISTPIAIISCITIFSFQYNKLTNAIGWHESKNGKYYILKNNQKATGFLDIGENTYYFNDNGFLQTSWQEIAG